MNISFHTLTFTDAPSVAEWKKRNSIEPANLRPTIKRKPAFTPEYEAVKMGIGVIYVFTVATLAYFFPKSLPILFIIGLLIFVAFYVSENSNLEFSDITTYEKSNGLGLLKRFLYVGEKLNFYEKGIKINNAYSKEEIFFLYEEISEMTLVYAGMRAEWDITASQLSFKHKGQNYYYHLKIDSEYRIKQLGEVVNFLYKKNIAFSEVNEDGKILHLLRLIEPPKPEKKKEIPSDILSLIEEIGDKKEDNL